MRNTMLLCALLLAGCPEAPPTSTSTTAGGEAPDNPAGPPANGEGVPEPEAGARPTNARFEINEGEGVILSGTISYPGAKTGTMRMDFLTLAESSHPQLAHAASLPGLGPYSIEIPKDYGELHIVAFIDVDGDGPTPSDPAATTKIVVGSEPLSGVDLALSDTPDLGELTPGATHNPTPTEGGAPPADGSPPADGAPPAGEAPPAQP